MYAAELESKMLRMIIPSERIDALVARCDTGLVLRNVTEARVIIAELTSSVKSKHTEMVHYQKLFSIMDGSNN
jgi:hypothetical protein